MKPKRHSGAVIVKTRSSDHPAGKESHDEGDELRGIEEAVEDFMRAAAAKDVKRMAQIVKMAHDLLHEIMDHESKESIQEEIEEHQE